MPALGRFSHRYGELGGGGQLSCPAGVIDSSSPLLDIANVEFGKARIRCLLEPDGKRWGTYKRKKAAIIHLQLKADQPSGCRISDFQLDLSFAPPALPGSDVTSISSDCSLASLSSSQPLVSLVKLPSPLYVSGAPTACQWSPLREMQGLASPDNLEGIIASLTDTAKRSWVFRSNCDADKEGRLTTASWIWEAGSEDMHVAYQGVLHAGVAFNHPGREFLVVCQAKGNARKARFRLRFSSKDKETQPRLWRLVPEASNEDLQQPIEYLESLILQLNAPRTTTTSATTIQQHHHEMHGSHSYGSATIGGAATVYQGDVHYTYMGNVPLSA